MAAVDPLVETIAQHMFEKMTLAPETPQWSQAGPNVQAAFRTQAREILDLIHAAGRLHPVEADEPVLEWATMEPFKGLMFWPTEAEAREYAGMTEHCSLYSRVRWWAHATDWELR